MECNRDEALRAKEIAERKFNARDFSGAKKFALKAQNLFPALEGINQMISTMDVYIAGELKVNGERDWYAILSVQAMADEETVKKQYRKLALQLHPDKNKSLGAEGAFQLISEAWSVLSDRSRKLIYDQKRTVKGCQQKASQAHRDHHSAPNANGFYNFTNKTKSHARAHKKSNSSSRSAAAPPRPPNADTFWTSCHRCKMQYEYLRIYLNHNLLCPNCKEPFLAIETGFPSNGNNCNASWSASQHHTVNHNSSAKDTYDAGRNQNTVPGSTVYQHGTNYDVYANQNYNWGPFSRTAGAASANASSAAAAQAANVVHQTYEKVRRDREESQAAAKREESLRRRNHASKRNYSTSISGNFSVGAGGSTHDRDRPGKRRRSITDDSGINYVGTESEQMVQGTAKSGSTLQGFKVPYNLSRETAQLDIRSMLMEKAKAGIKKKLEEWNAAVAAKLAEKEKAKQKQKPKENDNGKLSAAAFMDGNSTEKDIHDIADKQDPSKKDSFNDPSSDSEKEKTGTVSIDVPDPDFHDFDKDRSEKAFDGDQVWATYDGEDGMPRFYALVQKVISLKPFKIRMSFLTSKSNSEFGSLNWVGSGFAKTCGDFRVGRYEVNDTVNIFSHKVQWEKGPRGVIKIIPRKGEIWAVYKNWSPDWNEHTTDDVIYKYEMVEVLHDYNEEQGVSVTPLVKVAGFKTVFHRHMDPKQTRMIPKEEMFRFSHQVPSYILTGEEAPNAPKGCRELDPAATPVELLQVITEVKEHEPTETDEQQPVS
ncbi:putative DnaJ domain, Chaperone J-domain superfamily [Dioscorea sansibarensis]